MSIDTYIHVRVTPIKRKRLNFDTPEKSKTLGSSEESPVKKPKTPQKKPKKHKKCRTSKKKTP